MQPDPRSPLEVIEAEFLLQLLKGLLADPEASRVFRGLFGVSHAAILSRTGFDRGVRF